MRGALKMQNEAELADSFSSMMVSAGQVDVHTYGQTNLVLAGVGTPES